MKSKHKLALALPLYLLYKYFWATETELVSCWGSADLKSQHTCKTKLGHRQTPDRPYFLAPVTKGPDQQGPSAEVSMTCLLASAL